MAKVFITKYALTEGIKEIETDIIRSRFEDREYVRDGFAEWILQPLCSIQIRVTLS